MGAGVLKQDLVLRVDPERQPELLKQKYVRPFDFTGKPSKGMVYVGPRAIVSDEHLRAWVAMSIEYARALPKRKK